MLSEQKNTSTITNTKFYVSVVTLSAQDNTKLLQQSKSGFKHTVNWNKYYLEATTQAQNSYLDILPEKSFPRANKFVTQAFTNMTDRTSHTDFFNTNAKIKDNNVTIDGRNYFDQPVNH